MVESDHQSARLIGRVQTGDRAAATVLYESYFDDVYGYAHGVLRDAHEAEDVTQQVFVKVLQGISRYETNRPQPFRAWLFRIARNMIIDVLRERARTTLEPPEQIDLRRDGSAPPGLPIGELDVGKLSPLIERLPSGQRAAVVLRYSLGLGVNEIGELLGRSPKAVRLLQARGLNTLEKRLIAVGYAK